jgi:hypothetical protein
VQGPTHVCTLSGQIWQTLHMSHRYGTHRHAAHNVEQVTAAARMHSAPQAQFKLILSPRCVGCIAVLDHDHHGSLALVCYGATHLGWVRVLSRGHRLLQQDASAQAARVGTQAASAAFLQPWEGSKFMVLCLQMSHLN